MPVLIRFIFGGAILAFICYLFKHNSFLVFPKTNFRLWALIMLFYPLASAYPQEIIYRAFFFHRYSKIFKTRKHLILASGICFGMLHLFFFNTFAIVLGTFGGLMFSYTYSKSNSVVAASIEHALWGDLIFTIGLGVYFFSGAIH